MAWQWSRRPREDSLSNKPHQTFRLYFFSWRPGSFRHDWIMTVSRTQQAGSIRLPILSVHQFCPVEPKYTTSRTWVTSLQTNTPAKKNWTPDPCRGIPRTRVFWKCWIPAPMWHRLPMIRWELMMENVKTTYRRTFLSFNYKTWYSRCSSHNKSVLACLCFVHMGAILCNIRYIKTSIYRRFFLSASSLLNLTTYTYADWRGDPNNRHNYRFLYFLRWSIDLMTV